MAGALIEHKRINTTVQKAEELRKFVEPLITRAKATTAEAPVTEAAVEEVAEEAPAVEAKEESAE